MRQLEALQALARLAADNEADHARTLTEAAHIVGAAIGSDDVRLFAGDGVRFEAYPKRENEDFFGLSPEGLMERNTGLRRLGRPVVYHVGPDRLPRDLAPADGQAGGTHLALALWYGQDLAGSVVANGPWKPAGACGAGQFLEAAGAALAVMLERVADAERGMRVREQMNALSNVTRVFTEAKSMESVLQDLANAINTATGLLASVDVLNADGGITMRSTGASRYAHTPLHESWMKMIQAPDLVKALILRDREPVLLPDLQHDTRVSEEAREFYTRASIVSGATFPLLVQDKIIGLLRVGSLQPNAFSSPLVELLEELAVQAAMVVNAMQLYEEQERAQTALRASEERFRSLVQNASDLITVIEADTTTIYQSPSIRRVLGYEADSVVGDRLIDAFHPDDAPGVLAALDELMANPEGTVTGEGRVRDHLGDWRYLEFIGTDQRANPAIGGLVLNVRDVSERKALEQQLRHQALHDPLTKLANRTRFMDRLEHALLRSSRTGNRVAVLFMDLDDFKGVNDSLGHSAGDRLLTQVAERVQSCLREIDTVARLGGDEFALLIENVSELSEATEITDRVFAALRPPFDIGGKELLMRASIGVAVSGPERHGTSAEALLRDADVAMYAAKWHGKDCYEVFEERMQVSMMERLDLLSDLRHAVERGQFVLHYQPVMLLKTQDLYGFEALVRWQHPRHGLMPPGEFISLAEDSGAILGLGRWVLEEACRQAAAWQASFPDVSEWTLSVNVSAKQLQSPSFFGDVARVLRETGLQPFRLVLEITESVMMQNASLMLARLRDLKGLGVRLAIDDFGTGYSSLAYLRQFPFDLLKIDKSFIDDVGIEPQGKEMTRAIVELGKTLDFELVAEGIEQSEQLARLAVLECELGQGFFFAEPLQPEDAANLLAQIATGVERRRGAA